MPSFAPIALFVFKRPDHTRETLDALLQNKGASETDLYIFADYPSKPVDQAASAQVREIIRQVEGFKSVTIVEREKPFGLAKSIISGVSQVFEKHERVIVLEDDLLTAKTFISYINEALDVYEDRSDILSATGYCYPQNIFTIHDKSEAGVILLPRACSWSWGTWKSKWQMADWDVSDFETFKNSPLLQKQYNATGGDKVRMLTRQMEGKLDSWAIRWDYTHFKHSAFCVYPKKSLVTNIGFGQSASNTKGANIYEGPLFHEKPTLVKGIQADPKTVRSYLAIYDRGNYWFRLRKFINRWFS